MMKRFCTLLLAFLLALSFVSCAVTPQSAPSDGLPLTLLTDAPEDATAPSIEADDADAQAPPELGAEERGVSEDGVYDSKEDVALYLYLYGHLPCNYITKKEAETLGWTGGSLEPYAPGKCIGGGRFGNYEGRLPAAEGRRYTECDIDTLGAKSRGAKRIVFSNDGLIYYTGDHYETFELLYGEE
ncbi:MAG: ribonuclease [Oscillospiraceae bacterium]|nr:ribonuclease [Oscillospiraceae bacterium]